MQDEHFIREWTELHEDFTADVRGPLGAPGQPHRNALCTIGPAYDEKSQPARPALSHAAQASLRGLAASAITVVLWVLVMLVATPAPGLAASPETSAQLCACVAYFPLA
jgi:hypothetical protein